MGMERAGVTFASLMGLGPAAAVETAQLAEELGYRRSGRPRPPGPRRSRCWPRPARRPRRSASAPGVLALQLRTPMVVAMAGATLQALHPDHDIAARRRHLLTGRDVALARRALRRPAPGPRPRVRARSSSECLSGEKVDFAGDFYQVKGFRLGVRLGERRPKIVDRRAQPEDAGPGRRGGRRRGCSTTCPPRTSPWSVEQVRKGGDADDLRLRPRRCLRARGRRRAGPARPLLLRGRRLVRERTSSGPATATRWRRSASGTPPAIGTGALAAVSATAWSTAST